MCNPLFKVADIREEHQRETEGLLDSIRETSKELKLLQLSIDAYIPFEFQVYQFHFGAITGNLPPSTNLGDTIPGSFENIKTTQCIRELSGVC